MMGFVCGLDCQHQPVVAPPTTTLGVAVEIDAVQSILVVALYL